MSTPPGVSTEDWDVWRDYFRGTRELAAALDRRLQDDAGISHPDYLVLLSLWQAPEHQLRTGELAARLTWEKSRVSHQVSRMEARGLVERRECDTDLRGVWVTLTDEGARLFHAASDDHVDAIREWFLDPLDEQEKFVIARVSQRMRALLGTAQDALPPEAEAQDGDAA